MAALFSKYMQIYNHVNKLIDNKQQLCNDKYSQKPVEFEVRKTYINTNSANDFIKSYEFSIEINVFFMKKQD